MIRAENHQEKELIFLNPSGITSNAVESYQVVVRGGGGGGQRESFYHWAE